MQKLHERYASRIATFAPHHPVAMALMPVSASMVVDHCPKPRYAVFGKTAVKSPLRSIRNALSAITEKCAPYHPACSPGHRLVDDPDCVAHIHYYTDHPKKSKDEAMVQWVKNDLMPHINQAFADPNATVLFTDGSVSGDSKKSASACMEYLHPIAYNLTWQVCTTMGACHSFDCELVALVHAVMRGIHSSRNVIHIFSDSESGIKKVLDASNHAQQLVCISCCLYLRAWLQASPFHSISFHYCPSHFDIKWNEAVDKLAADGARNIPQPSPAMLSVSAAKSLAVASLKKLWHEMAAKPSYWGATWPSSDAFRPITHTGGFPMKTTWDSNSLTARMVRMLLGHAPTAEYNVRKGLHPDIPIHCICVQGGFQMRDHIFNDCSMLIALPGARKTWSEYTLALDPFPILKDWLEEHPIMFTFGHSHSNRRGRCHTCTMSTINTVTWWAP